MMGKESNIESKDIFQKAINKWGKSSQIILAIEELSELSQALCKSFRGDNYDDVIDEMADVIIMIQQLKIMIGDEKKLNDRISYKIKRLEKRLNI